MFFKGVCFAWAVMMTVQDIMGLSAWQAWEQAHWTVLPWWVLGVLAAIIAIAALIEWLSMDLVRGVN
jgi:hypothetical protein